MGFVVIVIAVGLFNFFLQHDPPRKPDSELPPASKYVERYADLMDNRLDRQIWEAKKDKKKRDTERLLAEGNEVIREKIESNDPEIELMKDVKVE